MRAASSIVDISAAMMTCNAILGALVARERPGIGQYVETALFDGAIAPTGQYGMNFLTTGEEQERFGNGSGTAEPVGIFHCKDGPVCLAGANERNYQRLTLDVLNCPALAEDPDFRTPPFRFSATPLADPVAAPLLGQHTDEILAQVPGYDSARIAALKSQGAVGP